MRLLSARSVVLTSLLLAVLCFASDSLQAAPPQEISVLIGFKQAPGRAEEDIVRQQGGTVRHTYWLVPAIAARVPATALAGLARHPSVTVVEPDVEVQAHDLELDNAWGVKRIGSETAHLAGQTGAGVRVAVIDTGIDYSHPDLDANYAGGWDFVNNDADPMDDHGHGTHVAGTIAAEDNGVGVVGAAPGARLYALKVLSSSGSGSFSDILSALQWCIDNGIQVTNNSYGSTTDPGTIVRQGYDSAYNRGVLSVASAGNSGTSTGTENVVGYPARFDSVVAVGATTIDDLRASFSSTGPALELAAPGVSIYSTLRGGGYGTKSGTSMACPHVVGAAAVLFGTGVVDNADARFVLAASALDLGATGLDIQYGYGLIDIPTALSFLAANPPAPPSDPDPTPPPAPLVASIDWIGYSLFGGKNSNKGLRVTVEAVDETNAPLSNATLAVQIARNGRVVLTGQSITDSSGSATFTLANAQAGTYVTLVTSLVREDCEWDGLTPVNSFAK